MQPILLAGFVIMALSSIAIYAKGSKDPEIRHHTYLHATVPFIAATAYLAMTLGVGDVASSDGVVTLTARYADWSVTTPLLLAGLILTGTHDEGRPAGFMVAAITLDVIMIATGLLSSVSPNPSVKLIWYLWSSAAFLGVLYVLWVPILNLSAGRGGPMAAAYRSNLVFLSVVWFAYPIVFALAPEGLKLISATASTGAILVLDVIAKVVYAFTSAANVERAHGQRRAGT